ncbi:DUF2663 family protein [Alkalihalobacillus sp. LMS39]|uniref:DUF2663 family protein n=1 Tax=Alkalihalobacillus sp. LMS39 TaxID=2924032 RepID=UPI001FB1CD70|nr:DUF2663 family protein [Alkalihalobacillus sp. LMS39]UOE92388.1 YpbF family protein [Alkalihalobacillus sp. LMS39]
MLKTKKYHQYVSSVGKVLLDTLIERKEEEEKTEKLLKRWAVTTIICLLIGLIYCYLLFTEARFIQLSQLQVVSSNVTIFMLVGLFMFCLLQVKYRKKKFDKAEEEYETLRHEIIERAEELWDTTERWEHRYDVFDELKSTYDVNLFHK